MLANQCCFITNGVFTLSSQEGVTHRGVNYEWFWLNAAAVHTSVCFCVTWFEWFAKWYCRMQCAKGSSCEKYMAIFSYQLRRTYSAYKDTNTRAYAYTTTNCLHLKMSINIYVCIHSLILWKWKTHHIICSTVLWIIICSHNLMSDMDTFQAFFCLASLCISKSYEY